MNTIFFHGHCMDGWCAAYVASKKYPEAELVPLDHGKKFDFEQVKGKDVLMLDFSLGTREQNDRIASLAKSFRIYDHHKTAQAVLEGAPYAVFDMGRSGAGLTWDYLFGKDGAYETMNAKTYADYGAIASYRDRPWYVNFTEDRDLWNWKLPDSRKVNAYIGTLEFTKEDWDHLDNTSIEDATMRGQGALLHIKHYVREAAKLSQTGEFNGYKTAVLNVPYLNCSEVGNELAKTHTISLTWFERDDQFIQFSLRSIGNFDVSEVAKSFNGGGHKNASGFQLPLMDGRNLIDSILERSDLSSRSSGSCV